MLNNNIKERLTGIIKFFDCFFIEYNSNNNYV